MGGGGGRCKSHCISLNELSGSISLANGKGRTQDKRTGRANQLEMMERGNFVVHGVREGDLTNRKLKTQAIEIASFISFNTAVDFSHYSF